MYRQSENNLLNTNISSRPLHGEFGAPQQISTGRVSWLHYFRDFMNNIQQRVPRAFGWAAITLGIGPYSSSFMF